VPGGLSNVASGRASFAAGQGAKTQSSAATPTIFNGAFVWADSNSGGAPQNFHASAVDEFAVRSRGGVRLVTGVDAAGLPTKTFSIAAASGDVIAPNIVTAQGKFAAPTNFPGGINNKQIGDRFRDNSIVAWARVNPEGQPFSSGQFGIVGVTRTAVGAYTVTLDVSALSGNTLAPLVTPEIDNQPTSAATLRIASVNTSNASPNTVQVWINNGAGTPVDNEFVLIVTAK
jgi:hypothetical protein